MRFPLACVFACCLGLLTWPGAGSASTGIRYGIQDDAWLLHGPGELSERLDRLEQLGPDLVRLQPPLGRGRDRLRASSTGATPTRCCRACTSAGSRLSWRSSARPRGRTAAARRTTRRHAAPTSRGSRAPLRRATAWVRDWLIWNEPNQRRWLRPASPVRVRLPDPQSGLRRDPRRQPACPRRGWSHRTARERRRRLARRLDSRHAQRRRPARRVRPSSVSGPSRRSRRSPAAAATARRSRWRHSSGSWARSLAPGAGSGSG